MLKVVLKSAILCLIFLVLINVLFHSFISFITKNDLSHTSIDYGSEEEASDPVTGMGAATASLYQEFYKENYRNYAGFLIMICVFVPYKIFRRLFTRLKIKTENKIEN